MQGINHRVIAKVDEWLASGQDVWLMTILETYGASPRPAGTLCAYNFDQDSVVGSLSGGCIEDELLRELKLRQRQSDFSHPVAPEEKIYGETPEEQSKFQLPCGGRLRLSLEYLSANESTHAHFAQLNETLEQRQRIVRTVDKSDGRLGLSAESATSVIAEIDEQIVHPLGPAYRMLIIGAGEVTRYLIPLAESVDIQVAVCDPRESFSDRTQLRLDHEVLMGMPDDLVRDKFSDRYCAIVALAHDPRVDDMALMEALTTDAFFIGAMGSARTSSNRRVRLRELGITDAQLDRLHAPIGVAMGSKTPPEIAISVIAQVIQERSKQIKAEQNSIDELRDQA